MQGRLSDKAMDDRMLAVVNAVKKDLQSKTNTLRVEQLVDRTMIFAQVPKRLRKRVLELLRYARETGLLSDA